MIVIGVRTFVSQKAATKFYSDMLHRYRPGDEVSPADAVELNALLKRHPEVENKVGVGIIGFGVRETPWRNTGFEIIRADDSSTDFSFLQCIKGTPASPMTEALQAMRAEIADAIISFKDEKHNACGHLHCAVSGRQIDHSNAHVDHAPPWPFNHLARRFLLEHDIVPDATFVTASCDNQYTPRIVNPEIAKAWTQYHGERAVLRIVSKAHNLATNAAGRWKD